MIEKLLARIGPRVRGTPAVSTTRHASLSEAAVQMKASNVGALVVYSRDGRHLLGIVSERDIARAIADGKDPSSTKVDDVMSKRLVVKHHYPSRREAAALMRRHAIRHLIVRTPDVDRVISMRDVTGD